MVGANEVQKSGTEAELSLAALELNALRPKTHAATEDGQPAQPAAPTVELTLNGNPTASCTGRRFATHRRVALGGSALLDLC